METEEFGGAVTEDPSAVHLLARVVVALFGALTPWVVWNKALPGIDVIDENPRFPILGKSYPARSFPPVKAKG